MILAGDDCTYSPAIIMGCRNSLYWSSMNYCLLSCYNAGLGYDEDIFCITPTLELAASCTFCSNEAPFWMKLCSNDDLLLHLMSIRSAAILGIGCSINIAKKVAIRIDWAMIETCVTMQNSSL